jgi:class 3 adenylate cyclase
MSKAPRFSDEDLEQLATYVRSLGATEVEVAGSTRVGGLGSLALDLAIRPAGDPGPADLEELAASCGADPEFVHRLWVACGLPESSEFPFPVTPDAASAIELLVGFAAWVGEETVLGFARVIGASVARMAEALSNVTRVGVEAPQRAAGTPYPEVVREYSTVAREALPGLLEAVGALFRRHLVLVSYQLWSTDEEGAAVRLDLTVGFADLVGSTEALGLLSVRDIATMVDRFEQQTWDVVTGAGGRVVKLIGDEAMFVHADASAACRTAQELVASSPQPIRVGLARGPVVALHGDYYGPTVNLAARLVGVAPASCVLVSDSVQAADPDHAFEPVDVGILKGFAAPVRAFRVVGQP